MNITALPVKKNEELTLTIESVSADGQGVSRKDGYVLFVPGALMGETVRVHVIKATKGYAVAKLLYVETPSPDRVTPACPVYASCGGCTLLHLRYAAQLQLKRQSVIDAMERLGGFINPPVEDVVGMEDPFRYRNKGSFPIGLVDGSVCAGLYAEKSHRLVPVCDCPIESRRIMDVLSLVVEWANTYHIAPYDEETKKGLLRHVTVRETATGETMAVIVATRAHLPHADALLSLLSDVDSVYQNINSRDTNVIFGSDFTLLAGRDRIVERIGEHSFSISPQSFLQVNARQTERLYGIAAELLSAGPSDVIVDAYCGIGTITLKIAAAAKRVIGIESVPEAVTDARKNAESNGIFNAEFICADVSCELPSLLARQKPSAVVVDPPRKGMDLPAVRAIAESDVKKLVYVSCNPATLARDCRLLAESGFSPVTLRPVDMFPHTGHVETVVLMTRSGK